MHGRDHYAMKGTGGGEESASRMMEEEPAEQPAKGGMVVDNVSIKRAKNGGWIVQCSKHEANPSGNMPGKYENNEYVFTSLAEAVPFIEQEFGASAEGETAAAPAQPGGAYV